MKCATQKAHLEIPQLNRFSATVRGRENVLLVSFSATVRGRELEV